MTNEFVPLVGDWYRDETGNSFKIIRVDTADDSIEVQYLDGAVEAMELDTWSELEIVGRAPPEDWSAAYDDIEASEVDETEAAMRPHEWGNPLDTFGAMESDD